MLNTSKQKAENAEIVPRNRVRRHETTQFIRIRALRSFRRYWRYFESRKIGGQSWPTVFLASVLSRLFGSAMGAVVFGFLDLFRFDDEIAGVV